MGWFVRLIGIPEEPKGKGAGLRNEGAGLKPEGAGPRPKGAELPASFSLHLQRLAEAFEQHLPCEHLHLPPLRPHPHISHF